MSEGCRRGGEGQMMTDKEHCIGNVYIREGYTGKGVRKEWRGYR